MATIYLSSTYNDLKACREAVYHALRQMRHDVIAMEDYVATDQRPTEKCLADVAASDLYIGIIAWRYGYVPPEQNPDHKSITEIEYRQALHTGKSCLLFLLDKDAPWPSTAMDAITGGGKRGKCIVALRRELAQATIVSFFKSPEELASLVSAAVSNWEKSRILLDTSNTPPSLDKGLQDRAQREERLKALIIDHRGFIQSRLESFVGRAQELAAIRKSISSLLPTGGYLTITGQAGQGKSSIIARLVQDTHPDEVAHHFIPFNPGPDHQVSLLRDLMAQLILRHDLSDYYVASESRPALRDFFPKVLDTIAAKGTQEVIFIDGLDQLKEDADGERDLSSLPDNPPQGIVFVLGTRPNETLYPLELRKPHHPYLLPGITRHDFGLILQHRNVRLEPGLADRFYKAMGENALYLDLVAKELAQAGEAKPEEIIERIADDPENIFSLSTNRLKRHAVEWREVLKPLLGVLLVAREPLTGRHLRAILDLDDERLREGIARLGGLVADNGKNCYSLFHLKLYDYLRQDVERPHKAYIFARDEEEGWHDTLAHWCERGDLSLIWEPTRQDPVEQERREYARKHCVTHLYLSHEWQQPQNQRLFAVLDTVEYEQAKIRDDPSTRSYILELDLGRQATMWKGWTLEEGLALLPRLWQYTLLRCSLTSRADRYSDEAFRLLVLLGRKQQALGLAELLTDPARKVSVLLQIAKQLREQENEGSEWLELLMRAADVARTIQYSIERARSLSVLGTALTQAQQWTEAERVIGTIPGGSWQAETSRKLGTALAQAQQWTEAERVIGTLPDRNQQAEALSVLGTALAQAQQWEHASQVWTEAERVIGTISDSNEQAKALSVLGTALAQAQQWTEAEWVIGIIHASSEQGRALSTLATAMASADEFEKSLHVIQRVWRQVETRDEALSLFSIASVFISHKPEVGVAFFDAFNWVDTFLGG